MRTRGVVGLCGRGGCGDGVEIGWLSEPLSGIGMAPEAVVMMRKDNAIGIIARYF